jgi:hypothetical protein
VACGRAGFDEQATIDADLTADPRNCGRAGHDCGLGDCSAGVCQPFAYATGEPGPWGLAIDSNNIYWTNDVAPGSLKSCPLTGCPASGPTTIWSAATEITRVAVDSSNIYFTQFSQGEVDMCPLSGCGAAPMQIATGESQPMGITAGNGTVYWAVSGGTEIHQRAIAGGATLTFANTSGPRTLAVDGSSLYWVSAGGEVGTCAQLPAPCPSSTDLASAESSPYLLSIYNGDIYWSNNVSGTGSIAKCSISGCGGVPTTVTPADFPFGIAVDASGIYWDAGGSSGVVLHCPLSGCAAGPEVLATGQNAPFTLLADARFLYWTNSGDGRVMVLAKP